MTIGGRSRPATPSARRIIRGSRFVSSQNDCLPIPGVFTESFNKADGVLGPDLPWITSAATSFEVVSNAAQGTGANNGNLVDLDLEPGVQAAQIEVVTFSGAANTNFLGLIVQYDTSGGGFGNGFLTLIMGAATVAAGSGVGWTGYAPANGGTNISGIANPVPGDVIRLEINGTTLTAKINGSTIGTYSDPDIPSPSTSKAGISGGSNVSLANLRLDNFQLEATLVC